jgi:anti-sigma regulatory factor (Ser/Thr protein kinase)
MTRAHRTVAVAEASQPVAARASARELAERSGFDEADAHRVGIVATEMATNLVKHTRGGEILLRNTFTAATPEIELLAIDRGPGIADVARSLTDGHSTAGSPGTGLGAIQRLSDDFDIYSTVDRGTIVLARIRKNRAPRAGRKMFDIGAVSVAKSGEDVCGDGWCVQDRVDDTFILMADGLGHGQGAADAAEAAITTFTSSRAFSGSTAVLQAIHEGMRHTRGAAVALAAIHPGERVVRFAGVGNIAATVHSNGAVRHAVSHNGTLGHQARHFREYTYPWTPDAFLVMHSDGLTTHWSLDGYPGLRARRPSVIAAVLYRDFSRQRDDVTVLVARERHE